MSIFKADYRFDKITDITAADLKNAGAKLLLLDADNTLSLHGSQKPASGVPEWLEEIRKEGFVPVIISNNSENRIRPFAEKLGLPFVFKSAKPLPKGFKKATEKFGKTGRNRRHRRPDLHRCSWRKTFRRKGFLNGTPWPRNRFFYKNKT